MVWKKIVDAFLVIILVAFAWLQLNDPDALYWIAVYGVAAVVVFLGLIDKQTRSSLIFIVLIYAVLTLYYSPAFFSWIFKYHAANIAASMSTDKLYIEETREFFGVLICLVIVGFEYFMFPKPPVIDG